MVLGVTDSPSNPMSQNTGQICRPYKCLTLSNEGWCGIVSRANDIVFDDYEKYFHSLASASTKTMNGIRHLTN